MTLVEINQLNSKLYLSKEGRELAKKALKTFSGTQISEIAGIHPTTLYKWAHYGNDPSKGAFSVSVKGELAMKKIEKALENPILISKEGNDKLKECSVEELICELQRRGASVTLTFGNT